MRRCPQLVKHKMPDIGDDEGTSLLHGGKRLLDYDSQVFTAQLPESSHLPRCPGWSLGLYEFKLIKRKFSETYSA